jgi:Icc-related predicted phosphoesterase
MKFVAISDTHSQHRKVVLPQADCIIHAGDVSSMGRESEVIDFLDWFSGLDYKYKIFIAGNHDFFFERCDKLRLKSILPNNVIYLNDSRVEIEGIKIWGSPISPWFYNWAFNRYRGEQIRKHWALIPADTDILITHGPVFGRLDKTASGDEVGCKDLLEKINEIEPKVHICGHIHEAYGEIEENGIKYINASVVNLDYKLVNQAVEFEI